MARNKSIILSKEEKKAVVTDLKAKIAASNTSVKTLTKELKLRDKEHAAFLKATDKSIVALTKELASHTAQLSAMTAKPAAI